MLQLSQSAARDLLLAAQGLTRPPQQPATKVAVLETIRRMGALQIDTISVVARSPYFVLWSRLGAYDPAWLDELLALWAENADAQKPDPITDVFAKRSPLAPRVVCRIALEVVRSHGME